MNADHRLTVEIVTGVTLAAPVVIPAYVGYRTAHLAFCLATGRPIGGRRAEVRGHEIRTEWPTIAEVIPAGRNSDD